MCDQNINNQNGGLFLEASSFGMSSSILALLGIGGWFYYEGKKGNLNESKIIQKLIMKGINIYNLLGIEHEYVDTWLQQNNNEAYLQNINNLKEPLKTLFTQAYNIIKDKKLREKYDAMLEKYLYKCKVPTAQLGLNRALQIQNKPDYFDIRKKYFKCPKGQVNPEINPLQHEQQSIDNSFISMVNPDQNFGNVEAPVPFQQSDIMESQTQGDDEQRKQDELDKKREEINKQINKSIEEIKLLKAKIRIENKNAKFMNKSFNELILTLNDIKSEYTVVADELKTLEDFKHISERLSLLNNEFTENKKNFEKIITEEKEKEKKAQEEKQEKAQEQEQPAQKQDGGNYEYYLKYRMYKNKYRDLKKKSNPKI
jgi:hypothetical protein